MVTEYSCQLALFDEYVLGRNSAVLLLSVPIPINQ